MQIHKLILATLMMITSGAAFSETVQYFHCITPSGAKKIKLTPCSGDETLASSSAVDLAKFRESPKVSYRMEKQEIVLNASRDGHYYIRGKINGREVTFVVDTGASSVAIPIQSASAFGISGCSPALSNTANGTVNSCITVAEQIQLGDYTLHSVEINLLPNLSGAPLLGMSALSRFKMEQRNGVMRLYQ